MSRKDSLDKAFEQACQDRETKRVGSLPTKHHFANVSTTKEYDIDRVPGSRFIRSRIEIRDSGSKVLRSGALNVQPPFLHQLLHKSQVLRLLHIRNTNSKDKTEHASGHRLDELTWSLSFGGDPL